MKADKKKVQRHFARAAETYDDQAVVQERVADRLLDLVDESIGYPPGSALEIGCCTGLLTRRIVARFPQLQVLHVNDLVADFHRQVGRIDFPGQMEFLGGDIETIPLPHQYQLIISSSTFHWLHDLSAFFAKLRRHLQPGGLLAFAMYGPKNLQEIRVLTGMGLKYPSLGQLTDLLEQQHFEISAATEAMEILHFVDPGAVLQHLRQTGVNALAGPGWNRVRLQEFTSRYEDRFRVKQGVRLTYHPMYLVARPR
ncbi:MAG: malonyl-ACP O-methyltransferase BioC [Desulfobulbaceae bacterium]|nr:malonyl-ACP O-methyltransferase BioC [Desulfobulbaceae bacterium]